MCTHASTDCLFGCKAESDIHVCVCAGSIYQALGHGDISQSFCDILGQHSPNYHMYYCMPR